MFRDVPECSGMFRDVPCSWFYRRPCWSSHFRICFTEVTIYHLSFFQSCNVFSSIKLVQFNNIRQHILNWWHVFQAVYAILAIKHFKDIPVLKCLHRNTNYKILCTAVVLVYRALFQSIHKSWFQWLLSNTEILAIFQLKKDWSSCCWLKRP